MATKEKLTSTRVQEVFTNCLYADEENTDGMVKAEGIMAVYGFNPERLESHRSAIKEMLGELPDEFMLQKGGGWSFLNMCVRKDGVQWTVFHAVQEQLVALGLAAGYVTCPLPREMWSYFPGGMPYYIVDLTKGVEDV